jgi:hypothetical protein
VQTGKLESAAAGDGIHFAREIAHRDGAAAGLEAGPKPGGHSDDIFPLGALRPSENPPLRVAREAIVTVVAFGKGDWPIREIRFFLRPGGTALLSAPRPRPLRWCHWVITSMEPKSTSTTSFPPAER